MTDLQFWFSLYTLGPKRRFQKPPRPARKLFLTLAEKRELEGLSDA